MKTTSERYERDLYPLEQKSVRKGKYYALLAMAMLLAMEGAIFMLDAVLPLRGLGFYSAQMIGSGSWFLLPTHLLFPAMAIISSGMHPTHVGSQEEIVFLVSAFLFLFLIYLLALVYLPRHVRCRYILCSTLLLGIAYVLIPIVTSLDVYSYIAYARIGVIYHLNPLTTLPTAISADPVYRNVYWIHQPSAYGPTWILITCGLQILLNAFRSSGILSMLLGLRLLGLVMHLGSTWLIWSISGHLFRLLGGVAPTSQGWLSSKRVMATLAFAWNPLLLFEACVNAHNDVAMLFFILLAIWFLVRSSRRSSSSREPGMEDGQVRMDRAVEVFQISVPLQAILGAALLLAIATCLKVNAVLLVPGLFLLVWIQRMEGMPKCAFGNRLRTWLLHLQNIGIVGIAALAYVAVIVVSYAPFWQGGAILNVFRVNPATYRNDNSLPDLLAHLYNAIEARQGYPLAPAIGSPAEHFTHSLSFAAFGIIYGVLLVQALWKAIQGMRRKRAGAINQAPTFLGLLRWMALVWLLYSLVGSPWFWPWYLVTFFGLYALVEVSSSLETGDFQGLRSASFSKPMFSVRTLAVMLLTFSMLTCYCFFTYWPVHNIVPGLPGFVWNYLSSLWMWGLPLLTLCWYIRRLHLGRVFTTRIQGLTLLPQLRRYFSLPGK